MNRVKLKGNMVDSHNTSRVSNSPKFKPYFNKQLKNESNFNQSSVSRSSSEPSKTQQYSHRSLKDCKRSIDFSILKFKNCSRNRHKSKQVVRATKSVIPTPRVELNLDYSGSKEKLKIGIDNLKAKNKTPDDYVFQKWWNLNDKALNFDKSWIQNSSSINSTSNQIFTSRYKNTLQKSNTCEKHLRVDNLLESQNKQNDSILMIDCLDYDQNYNEDNSLLENKIGNISKITFEESKDTSPTHSI